MSDSLQPHGLYEILQARILEWVPFPFSRVSSQPKDQTQVSVIAGRLLTSWATREAHISIKYILKRIKQVESTDLYNMLLGVEKGEI